MTEIIPCAKLENINNKDISIIFLHLFVISTEIKAKFIALLKGNKNVNIIFRSLIKF